MGKITVELIRKKSEHNEGEIHSLHELSLHQEKLEKIELLDRVCRKLKILLLQNNAIGKIENLGRLKDLEYLNLALNLVEKIENLEGCESLKKLDLTLNFIGQISSVKNLRPNFYLEQLYLVGNPCHDFPGYREYIIAVLPQLKQLDGADVTKTERIQARHNFDEVEEMILMHEEAYLRDRERSKAKSARASGDDNDFLLDSKCNATDDEDDEIYWSKSSENTPEARREMCRQLEKQDEKKKPKSQAKKKPPRKFETADGRPLNMNEPKLSFLLHDEQERNQLTLDLAVPRFMCTTLIDADVQPTYVRITVKDKVFQLLLPEEVKPDSSYAQRSQTTGHLIVTMPKVHETSTLVWKGGSNQMIDLTKSKGVKFKETSRSETETENTPRKSSSILKNKVAVDQEQDTDLHQKLRKPASKLSKSKGKDAEKRVSWNDNNSDNDVPPLI